MDQNIKKRNIKPNRRRIRNALIFIVVSMIFVAGMHYEYIQEASSVAPVTKSANFSAYRVLTGYKKYKADWEDLDSRPLPEWFDRAKLGIMINWGLFSFPGFIGNESYWKRLSNASDASSKERYDMENKFHPGFQYPHLAPKFSTELFESDLWASLFEKAGIRYVIMTAKHHDGFTLFRSKRTPWWSAVNVGPMEDLLASVAKAVRQLGIKFGVYYSLEDWFHPKYLDDRAAGFSTQDYVKKKMWPEIKQMIYAYRPFVLWTDGDKVAESKYWDAISFRTWLYNESPVRAQIVVNDQWGLDTRCRHGDFHVCKEKYSPGVLQNHKWEYSISLDRFSFSYRHEMKFNDVITIREILEVLVKTVSCGGNLLIHFGPNSDGIIPAIFQERLVSLGKWLEINRESIYNTSPWRHQNDTGNGNIWYTCHKVNYNAEAPTTIPREKDTIVAIYAIFFNWSKDNILRLLDIVPDFKNVTKIELLGEAAPLNATKTNNEVAISLPNREYVRSEHAWVVKFKNWRNPVEELAEERREQKIRMQKLIEEIAKRPFQNKE